MSTEFEDDLRTTAEQIAAEAERLVDIEQRKSGLDVDDPERHELAAEATEVAELLHLATEAQEALMKSEVEPSGEGASD